MGISERRRREKEERRKAILDAAEKLFFARSYDNVSMDEIATMTELSKPAIYLYFGDKESLYLAVVERGYRAWLEMIRDAVRDAENGIDRLAAIGISYNRFVRKYPDYHRMLTYFRSGRFDRPDAPGNPALEAVYGALQEISELNLSAIHAGIKDGTLRSDIDPVILSILLSTFAVSVHNLNSRVKEKIAASGIDDEQFSHEFIDMMYNMMENPDNKVKRRTKTDVIRS